MSCCVLLVILAVLHTPIASFAQVTFIDANQSSGFDFVHHTPIPPASPYGPSTWAGSGPAIADYDGDRDLDVYMLDSYGWPNQLYRNNGDKTFTNVTAGTGLNNTGSSRVALMLDFDNDGDPDLLLGNDTQGYSGLTPSQVFRNDGGTFVNVTAGSGFTPNAIILGGMAASDYDGDGLLDVYVTTWDTLLGTPSNYLYHNRGNLQFEDVTQAMGLRTPATQMQTWTPVFVDFDQDGDQDLFTAVDFEPNYYFRLDTHAGGPPTFTDISVELNVFHCCAYQSGNDMGVAIGDIEGDGDLDIYTTNITLAPPNQMVRTNLLLVNDGLPSPFSDQAVARGVWDTFWGWGTSFFDVDLDGDLDLYAVNGRSAGDGGYWSDRPAKLFVNDGGGQHPNGSGYFTEIGEAAGADDHGNGRGFVPFDYDADGDLDLLILNVAQPARLYENVTPTSNHWLGINLKGTTRNRDAIGAKVRVTASGKTQLREIIGGGSFYTTPPLEAFYGLGAATKADSVRIDWPGGASTTIPNVPGDRRITIVEGAPLPAAVLVGLDLVGPSSVATGASQAFSASGQFWYAADADLTTQVAWAVAPSNAATINSGGLLAIAANADVANVTVTATYQGLSASRVVTIVGVDEPVELPPVVSITSPSALANLTIDGSEISLACSVTASNAVATVVWQSDAGSGACVPAGGTWNCGTHAVVVGENEFTITATDQQGLSGSDAIVVTRTPVSVAKLVVSPVRLEFGDDLDELEFAITLQDGDSVGYKVVAEARWLRVEPESGAIDAENHVQTHRLMLDRTGFEPGEFYEAEISVIANDADMEPLDVAVWALSRAEVDGPDDNVNDNVVEVPDDGPDVPSDNVDGGASNNDNAANPNDNEAGQDVGEQPRVCGAMSFVTLVMMLAGFVSLRGIRRR